MPIKPHRACLAFLLMLPACQDTIIITTSAGESTAEVTASTTEDATSDMTSTSEVTTSGLGTSGYDTSSSSTGTESCMPRADFCVDVVALCRVLDPKNTTSPGLCVDLVTICEHDLADEPTICTMLRLQCEIEVTDINCDAYADTCACLIDAHSWS